MAVTLYRCSKCRGLFNSVFEPNKLCRDCKLQQSGFQSQGGRGEVTVVEPEKPMGGGGIVQQQVNAFSSEQEKYPGAFLQNVGMSGGFNQQGQQNFSPRALGAGKSAPDPTAAQQIEAR